MQDYLLIYQGGDHDWAKRPKAELERVMKEWNAWFKELEASGNLRNPGAPLAPEGAVLSKNGGGLVTDTMAAEVKELIGGYSVLQADSLEQATELAKGAPFLKNNAQGRIVVRPVISSIG
ncbi:MAG: YciI family protein [bacterium]